MAGTTHALNAVADGLRLPLEFGDSGRNPLVAVPRTEQASPELKAVFDDIQTFYAMDRVPAVFRWMARDPIFLQGYWGAVRAAFSDASLDRLTKEVLALAASMSASVMPLATMRQSHLCSPVVALSVLAQVVARVHARSSPVAGSGSR